MKPAKKKQQTNKQTKTNKQTNKQTNKLKLVESKLGKKRKANRKWFDKFGCQQTGSEAEG